MKIARKGYDTIVCREVVCKSIYDEVIKQKYPEFKKRGESGILSVFRTAKC